MSITEESPKNEHHNFTEKEKYRVLRRDRSQEIGWILETPDFKTPFANVVEKNDIYLLIHDRQAYYKTSVKKETIPEHIESRFQNIIQERKKRKGDYTSKDSEDSTFSFKQLDTLSKVDGEQIIISEYQEGKHKKVIDEIPENAELSKEIETDFGRIERYFTKSYHSQYIQDIIKKFVFKANKLDKDKYTSNKKIAKQLSFYLEMMKKQSDFSETIKNCETLDELKNNHLKEYKAYELTYDMLSQIWGGVNEEYGKKPYGTLFKPGMFSFKIKNLRKSFIIPRMYNSHVIKLIEKEFEDIDDIRFSLTWRGFVVKPNRFEKAYSILHELYHPELDKIQVIPDKIKE